MAETFDSLRSMVDALAQRGTIKRSTETTKLRSLQIEAVAGEPIDDVEHVEPLGLTSVPTLGAEVIAAAPGGTEDQTVALVVFDRSVRPTTGAAGETIVYDAGTGTIQVRLDATTIKLGENATKGVNRAGDATTADVTTDPTFFTPVTGWIALVSAALSLTPPTSMTGKTGAGSATVLAED
jgi:phage baseplate assembly protein V